MLSSRGNSYWCSLQQRNEIDYPSKRIGAKDLMYKRLYSTINSRTNFIYQCIKQSYNSSRYLDNDGAFHGAIVNLNFNPDGSLLLAATENKAILLFDPFNHKLIRTVHNAHDDSLNYIKFLDDRLFASCSDDRTVAIWDIRNLRNKLRVLKGHSYWVKNIEYDPNSKLLLSSGYDGCINMWDINTPISNRSSNNQYTKALYLSCLMKMRLTHDNSKMVICTSEGYIMVIHDLDLHELKNDLCGFQSDLYRLMQKGHSCGFDFGSWYNRLFTAKRNRVELISDFPAEDDCHSLYSLDIHPHNWSIVSRNVSRDDTEWTCVHDIQGDKRPYEMVPLDVPKEGLVSHPTPRVVSTSSRPLEDSGVSSNSSSSSPDMHVSPVVIISARTLNRRAHATILNPNTSYRQIGPGTPNPPKIFKNLNRLTNYCQESSMGQGFIKEICFSSDGRVICSPYEYGFRILGFNLKCSEISSTETTTPNELYELSSCSLHPNLVVATKFSPTHLIIASGCLAGTVNFYQPVL